MLRRATWRAFCYRKAPPTAVSPGDSNSAASTAAADAAARAASPVGANNGTAQPGSVPSSTPGPSDGPAETPAPPPVELDASTPGAACPAELAKTCANEYDKLVCTQGKWQFNGSCDGTQRCDLTAGPDQGTCQMILVACMDKRAGHAFCDGLMRRQCAASGLRAAPQPCPDHMHCDAANETSCVATKAIVSTARPRSVSRFAAPMAHARDRSLAINSTEVPINVKHLVYARRDPRASSRNSFGNCGTIRYPGTKVSMRSFWGTHGALGGVPWKAPPGAKATDFISESLELTGSKVSYVQDLRCAQEVWTWVSPQLATLGILGGKPLGSANA